MREIKFRAWLPERKEMLIVTTVSFLRNASDSKYVRACDGYYPETGIHPATFSLNEASLMQYTGLHDKNGTEIYEDDLVLFEYSGAEEPDPCRVIFSDFQWKIKSEDGNWGDDLNEFNSEELEVIGNIYENPELLTPDDKPTV